MVMPTAQKIFQPEGVDTFLRHALGRHALFLDGDRDRFCGVVSWDTVNHLAAFGGLTFPRLRLIQGDQFLDENLYIRRNGRGYPRALVSETNALLRQGALLAIDGLELLHEPVAELCATVESAVQTPVAAELYASWCEGAPRVPQWDDHETLLLQVDGRKEWQLFEPTFSCPIAGCPAPPPAGDARWRGTLAPGDLLYIPRGWWYHDKAFAEPTLYLALTFQNLRAIDMIGRLLLTAQRQQLLRRDIPSFESAEARSSFLTLVQQELIYMANGPIFLGDMLRDMQEASDPRTEFNFPWCAAVLHLNPGSPFRLIPLLRFPSAFSMAFRVTSDQVVIPHNGTPVTFDWEAGEILEVICASHGATVQSLLEESESKMPHDRILAHVAELVRLGLVAARPADQIDSPRIVCTEGSRSTQRA